MTTNQQIFRLKNYLALLRDGKVEQVKRLIQRDLDVLQQQKFVRGSDVVAS